MTNVSLEKLVAAYDRGMVTGHELAFRLIQAAVNHPPVEILPLIPDELRYEVERQGMNPPPSPDAQRFVQLVCSVGPYDHEAWEREQQAAYYDGAWRWYRFLTTQQA